MEGRTLVDTKGSRISSFYFITCLYNDEKQRYVYVYVDITLLQNLMLFSSSFNS